MSAACAVFTAAAANGIACWVGYGQESFQPPTTSSKMWTRWCPNTDYCWKATTQKNKVRALSSPRARRTRPPACRARARPAERAPVTRARARRRSCNGSCTEVGGRSCSTSRSSSTGVGANSGQSLKSGARGARRGRAREGRRACPPRPPLTYQPPRCPTGSACKDECNSGEARHLKLGRRNIKADIDGAKVRRRRKGRPRYRTDE